MKRKIAVIICLILLPIAVLLGTLCFGERSYLYLAVSVAVVACIPFFITFEKQKNDARRAALLAVMTAISIVGRFAFAFLPSFKPVAAIVILCGMYLGAESGFMCGALTAIVSNFVFAQGAWTPFQMISWGVIGFVAGLLSKLLIKNRFLLYIYAAVSGVIFSLIMDVWTVLWIGEGFSAMQYLAVVATSLPVTAVYAVSNVLFMLILSKPIGFSLGRITAKYGVVV